MSRAIQPTDRPHNRHDGASPAGRCADAALLQERLDDQFPGMRAVLHREGYREGPERGGRRLWLRDSAATNSALDSVFPVSWVAGADGIVLAAPPPGMREIFAIGPADAPAAISTNPALLAALVGPTVDQGGLYADIRFGYRFDRRTIFAHVWRLRRGETVEADHSGVRITPMNQTTAQTGSDEALDELAAWTASAFERGACLELTAGVDSRLAFALGVAGGRPPRRAFTIGDVDSTDVQVAQALALRFGVEHRTIPVEPIDRGSLIDDTIRFVRGSGCTVNAVSYGWLPGVFRRLAPYRTEQVTGTGGEMAGGFYRSPADLLFARFNAVDRWVSLRVAPPGRAPSIALDRATLGRARSAVCTDARAAFGTRSETWNARTDRFYVDQRLRHWAVPVLRASSQWYGVVAPLLTPQYAVWCAAGRRGREGQRELIARLAPELGEIPYDAVPAAKTRDGRVRRGVVATGRSTRRILGLTPAPDLGAAVTAEALLADEGIRAMIHTLGSMTEGIGPCVYERLRAAGARRWAETGAVVTAAIALQTATRWRRALESEPEDA